MSEVRYRVTKDADWAFGLGYVWKRDGVPMSSILKSIDEVTDHFVKHLSFDADCVFVDCGKDTSAVGDAMVAVTEGLSIDILEVQ